MDARRGVGRIVVAGSLGLALLLAPAGSVRAESLEEETRRPPGGSSLTDDSERLRDAGPAQPTTDGQDDDSQDERGRTADQNPTNGLDDGSLEGGDQADPGGGY